MTADAQPTEHLRTLSDALDLAAHTHGDAEAYVEGQRRLTFSAWSAWSDRAAMAFQDRGVKAGDVVALLLDSGVEYAVAYAAVVRIGGVVLGVNPRTGARATRTILDDHRPVLALHDPATFSRSAVPRGCAVLTRSELLAARDGPALDEADRWRGTPSDPAVIICTSGTTGTPKSVWFDHANLAAAQLTSGVMSTWGDRRLVATPFSHAGYMAKVWDQIATATTFVVSSTSWDATDMLRLLTEERITVADGAPTQWAKLVELPEVETADLSNLRLGVCATAPAAPELVERVAAVMGCPLIVRYAMTESPSITGTRPTDPPDVQHRTVGRPQAGMEVRIVGADRAPLPVATTGRIEVRGPCVMRGYWTDPSRTIEVLDDDGWLRTNDLGYVREDGNLVLVGRADDTYLRGGYNVHPLEVEHVLTEHPAVAQVGIVGERAPVIGEIGVAFIVPTDTDHPPDLRELRHFVADRLADYKAPDRLELVDTLPLTAVHKIDRRALRRRTARRGPSA